MDLDFFISLKKLNTPLSLFIDIRLVSHKVSIFYRIAREEEDKLRDYCVVVLIGERFADWGFSVWCLGVKGFEEFFGDVIDKVKF